MRRQRAHRSGQRRHQLWYRLTFEGPARFQYDLDDEGKIKLNTDGTISVAWWLRDENDEWKPWMNNTFMKTTD